MYITKNYSFGCLRAECFKNDSTMDLVISYLQRMSTPLRLSTMRQMAQLTAFLTSSY